MKRILLSLIFATSLMALSHKAKADACGVSNLYFNLVTQTAGSNGSCTITFDFGWDQSSNGGNKWSFAHLWLATDYPSPSLDYKKPPTGAQLNSAFATFVIENGIIKSNAGAYPNGTALILGGTLSKTTLAGGVTRFRITNVSKTFATCPTSLSIKGDVWSSQADPGNIVSCFNGGLTFLPPLQDLTLAGEFFCGRLESNPIKEASREIRVDLSSMNETNNSVIVSYNVFVDNGNGTFNENEETIVNSRSVSEIYVSAGNNYSSGRIDYLPYSNSNTYAGRAVWVEATATTGTGSFNRIIRLESQCSALPVHFKSITAARNKERVAVKWETASESNNRGFNVQRNTGSEWKTIAFVFSQADGGNSSSTLAYEYNDVNTAKGVSQYRVQQVDIDGKASFSEIRSVRGETMKKSVIAFPNPSLDGKVNLVLEDNSAKTVIVSDMSGRIVKQYKNITTNNLTIDMLQSGMYSIQVTDLSTAEVSVEKVVIKKR